MDLDNHRRGSVFDKDKATSVYCLLEDELIGSKIPKPHEVVYTGRGMQMVWYIESLPANQNTIVYWKKLALYLASTIKSYLETSNIALDVDVPVSINPVAYLRAVGTYNTKAKKYTSYIMKNVDMSKYSLNDIYNNYYEPKAKAKQIRRKYFTTVTDEFVQQLNNARYEDMKTLIRLRAVNDLNIGHRQNTLCNIVCILANKGMSEGDILQELISCNILFEVPLPMREVESTLRAGLNYAKRITIGLSNTNMIRFLDISEEEQTCLRTIISKQEKTRRKLEKQQEKRNRIHNKVLKAKERIKTMVLQMKDFTRTYIAKKLGISLRKVYYILKEATTN